MITVKIFTQNQMRQNIITTQAIKQTMMVRNGAIRSHLTPTYRGNQIRKFA